MLSRCQTTQLSRERLRSSFAVCLDHVRGPFAVQLVGEAYSIDGMTFALGGTSFDYLKEIPIMSKFEIENRLLGYDRKWVRVAVRLPRRRKPPRLPRT